MKNNRPLKERIHQGELTLGSWITLAHPAIPEIMAKSGFDWLAVDLEHSVITIREAEELIRVIDLVGVSPLVRLTNNDPNLIKRVMDAGSHGVIVPMINTANEAKRAVSAVKYPRKGIRGVGLARAQGYGDHFREYFQWQEKYSIVIVQIEHIDAVNNLEEIFSVEGVDGFIIGFYDLSGSMGILGEFENDKFLSVMDRIKQIASDMKIPGGVHITEPDLKQLDLRVSEGYSFIAYSLDIRMLDVNCKNATREFERLRK